MLENILEYMGCDRDLCRVLENNPELYEEIDALSPIINKLLEYGLDTLEPLEDDLDDD